MGEKTITTQVKIDGEIVPDFSFDWEVEFQGEKYIMPLRIPQGAKENTSLNSTIDLTFQHWAIYQLKRWPFVTIQQIAAGTYLPDEEVATVQLNLKDFCILFGQVLEYYYGNAITINLNPAWQYKQEATIITISHTKIWNVLIDAFHDKYGVRWEIKAASDNSNTVKGGERYVIRVGYAATEVDHIFKYGFEGGLLKVERQVQSEEIRNMLKGRGGDKNIPFRYFKDTDPNNPGFRPDPDWVEELANIPFTNLMPATFRSYVQGWKAAHISKYPGYTAVGESNAYAPWAYRKGYTDTKFQPVEFVADEITINPTTGDKQVEILPGYSPYVKKGSSIDKYGPLPDTLDNNEDIYPTLQGTGLDIAVAVEQIQSDDVAESTENDAQIEDKTYPDIVKTNVAQGRKTAADASKRTYFTVATGKKAIIEGYAGAKAYNPKNHEDKSGLIAELDYTIKVFNAVTGAEHSASGIPAGDWYFTVEYSFNNTGTDALNVTLSFNSVKITSAAPDDKWRKTFDIWVKNIWNSSKLSTETDAQYAERVWKPVLGDKEKNTAKVVFTSGALVHEDYEFTIVGFPVPDSSKTYEGEQSHWRITLAKSEAELEATGLYVPSTQKQGKAGDTFVFIGTEMTHVPYVVDAEIRLDDWKKDQLGEVKEIKPTAVVTTDRVRLNNEGKPNALINQLRVGNSLRLFDKRFFNEEGKAYETLYLQSITYTYREPSSDDAALNPDVEIVLGNEYTISANPVSMMQGEISALQRQVGAISNVEQIVRAVGDKLYLRKDGISDRSLSPTQFFSLMTSGDFRAGLIGGAGWGFFKDENGNWVLETDRLSVRQDMSVNTLVINQAEGRGGMEIDTAAYIDGVTRVEDTPGGYVCYFDQKGGSVANLFHVDDVAFCNRWTPENADLKFYRRKVTAVGADYITLSKTDVNGTGVPAEGDNIIHFGNYTDKTRQYIKVRDVVGGGYERYIEELNSVNAAGVEYYFVGKQAGKARWFVGNKDLVPYSGKGDGSYIEYIDRKFNLHNVRLSITSSIVSETTDSEGNPIVTEKPLGNYFKELQQQIDGVVESFNGQGAPTLTNYPASGWTTDEERKRHNRDIYTDITPYVDDATTPTAGQSWRWYYNSETDYGWVKIADSDAVKALQMAKLSVLDSDVLFIQTNSETVEPALPTVNTEGTITALNGWSSQAPTWKQGEYIWQCTYVRKGDGTARFAGPTCLSGVDGKSVTVTATEVSYSTVHNSATQPADATFTLTSVPTLTAGQYLWSRTKVAYSNNQSTVSYGVSRIGTNGTNGTSITIKSTSVTYAKTTTPTQPADSAFTYTSIGSLNLAKGEYMWSKTTVVYSDNTALTSYGVSRIGSDGDTAVAGLHIAYASGITGSLPHPTAVTGFATTMFAGAKYIGVYTDDKTADSTDFKDYEWALFKGDDGRGIAKVEEEYYLSTSQTQLAGGSWLSEANKPAWQPGKFMWTRTKVTYTDGKTEYMGAVCVTGTPGTSVQAEYSADGSTWHPTFTAGDVWMRTSDDGGTTWSPAMRVVGEEGKDGQWRKFQWAKNNSATTAPTGIWYDTPLTAAAGEYVWMRSGIVVPPATAPATWDAATRLTGDKGADGQSVYMLDIDNEVSGVICDATGAVTGTYPTPQASVYKGSTKQTSGVTYSIPQKTGISTVNISTAGAITMSGMSADKAEITVQAKVDNVTLTSVVSLYKVKPGANGQAAVMYSIEPSVGNITRSMTGVLSATSVTCSVYKTTGNTARVLSNDHTLTYQRLPDGATGTLTRTNGVSSAVTVLPTTEAVIFELKNGSTVLDRERVPVLADASDLEVGGRNLLLNTTFNGKENWSFSSIAQIDESKPYMGYNSVKLSSSGNTSDHWSGLRQTALGSFKGGDVLTISLYSFTADKSAIDPNAAMEIDCRAADGTRLAIASLSIVPTTNNVWEKKVFTRQLPANTAIVQAYIYLTKNGTIWINSPKLEFGNVATDWTPAPEDIENRVDTFDYLKEAMKGNTVVDGGLVMSSLMKLGTWSQATDPDKATMTKVYAGINGIYANDRSIASWWGGDMVDRFNDSDALIKPEPANAAAALVRMNGTGYFAKGNIMWRADGSGSVAGGKLSWDASGNVTLGAGVTVAGGSGMSDTTLTSLLQFVNGINQLIVPVDASGNELPYNGLTNSDGTTKIKAIKAKFNFYSVGGVSSLGMGGATGGGSGSGGGASALVDLLDVNISNLTKGQMLQYNGTHWANVSGIATEAYVNTRINNLINGAPAAYDTLKEIADVLQGNVNSIGDIMTALGNKADKSQLADYVTLGTAQTVSGQKTFSSAVRIGRADNTGDHNAIYFYGVTGDAPGSFNHTWIAERLWGGTESSELVLFKGNDVGNHTDAATVSTSGPDRIRHIAFGHLFQVPTATMSGLPSAVCASTSLKNVFGMARDRVTSYVDLYATSFIKTGGTASQFLMANGSVKALSDITSAYVTALGTSGNYLTWTKNGAVNNITVPFATTSQKLGTATVGSGVKPIYLNAGTPTASASTVGAANRPVYLNAGTITAGTYAFDYLTAYSHYLSVSSFTTVGNDKYLCVTTPAWHSQDIVLSLRVTGSNTYADCVIHGGCRSGELWGWQTRYNSAAVTGISKDTTTSQIAFYIRLSSTVTSIDIKSNCEVTVTNADYSTKTFIAVPTSGLFGSSFTGGDVKATSLAVSGASTLSSTLLVSGLATLNGGATIPTGKKLTIGPVTIEYDSANKGLKVSGGGLYTDSYLTALGIGNVSGSTGGGSNYDRLDSWSDYTTAKEGYVLSAKLGYSLYQDVNSLKSGAAVTVTTTGTGNAVTAISKSGTVITATKGTTFLTSHQSLTDYFKRGGGETMPAAYVDLTTYTSGAANYKNYQPGTYQIGRSGFSELVVNLALNSGSCSALQFRTTYNDNAVLMFRKTIDSNRVSGPWRKILTELNTKIENGVITINGTSITPLTQHQSLANYVTLNTAQSITGKKTFGDIALNGTVTFKPLTTATNLNDITSGFFHTSTDGNTTTNITNRAFDSCFSLVAVEMFVSGTDIRRAQFAMDGYGNAKIRGSRTSGYPWYTILTNANYSSVLDSRYYTESEVNTKLTDGSVTKVGTATVGSASRPVYLNGGVPTAGSYTFGNASGNAAINNGTVNTNLNADMLDGVHASGLFTALSNNASNNLSITVGGTTRQLRIGAIGAYEALTVSKNDNGGRPVYLLIADVTTWYGTTSSGAADTGIIGYFYGRRGGNMAGTSVQKIIAWCTHNNTLYRLQTDTTENNAILPRIVKYNNKYYLALYMTGSGRDHYFIGTKTANLLTSFITVNSDTSGQFAGLTVVHSESGMSHYGNASSATTLATARTINGTSFNGSANITTSYWGTARNISIADSTSAHTGAATSVNGSGNVTLKLPSEAVLTKLHFLAKGNSYIYDGPHDQTSGVGGTLNNLVISSWYGVSFTTSCAGQTYTGTNAVSINCRTGNVYAARFNGPLTGAVTGNATTATTLQTTRTIWGQNFNGGANVSGNMTGVGNIDMTGNLRLKGSANFGNKINFGDGDYVYLHEATDDVLTLYASKGINLNSNTGTIIHNVDILPSTSNARRLGSATINYAGVHSRQLINNTEALMWIWQATNHEIAFATNAVERMRISAAGTVAINITSPSSEAKLHVGGNIVATGGITALSSSSTSDMRLKRIIRDITLDIRQIAGAPSFIHAWKDAAEYGGGEFAGSSAQYWLRVLPQAVSGKQWLALDYGKTALLSAIALARCSETHEQRIRRLEKENERLREQIRQIKTQFSNQ